MAQRPHDLPSAVTEDHTAGGQDVTTTTSTTTSTTTGTTISATSGTTGTAGATRRADRGAPAAGPASPGTADATAGTVLAAYLHAQAADFLRSLRLHRESGADAEDASEAARMLRRSARRIAGTLHVYRPLTDVNWTDPLRSELLWLSDILGREYTHAARLARLRGALHRLSGAEGPMGQTGPAGASGARGSTAGGGASRSGRRAPGRCWSGS
ncbi:metal-binding protein [Streptomyces albireticuli]|uniref:Metal-binding protein n=1 Tax=Streptomyces albireticuli TaxID=1940 RepID=A0A1Z2L2L9_9ACTN|nr:metal-binding protein [Streptomyces albireticuli]